MSIIHKIKKYGLNGAFKVVLKKFFKIEIVKFNYYKTLIEPEVIQQRLKGLDLEVKELVYNDFLLGDKSVFFGKKLELMKQRCVDSTYKGFGVVENGVLLYSTWISLENMGLPFKSNYKLTEYEGYFEDSHCHVKARGKKIHSKLNDYCLLKLHTYGKIEALCIVIDDNIPAIKTQLNAGARYLCSFYAGKVFAIPFVKLNKKKYDCR